MNKYCEYCGKPLKENADYCMNCGKLVNKKNIVNNANIIETETPSKTSGFSLGSLIIAIFALIIILSLYIKIDGLETIILTSTNTTIPYKIGAGIGYTIIPILISSVGVILGLIGYKKSDSYLSATSLMLNILSLILCLMIIIYVILL